MYIDASAPRRQGDRAVLYSQMLISSSNQRCIKFWYNMNGQNVGTLNAGLKLANGRIIPRWTLSGNQGNVWKFGQFAANWANIGYKVEIIIKIEVSLCHFLHKLL